MNKYYYTVHIMNNNDKEESLTLEILETIGNKSDVTQRHLADNLGVALGLTNSYLRRCVRKGYIKIKQVPANRYLYYLTPKGFTEKSRLTARYLSKSFDFYREAGKSIISIYVECSRNNWQSIVLCGISELAEIAYIRAQEFDIQIINVFDFNKNDKSFLGIPVIHNLADFPKHDACLLTGLNKIEDHYRIIAEKIEPERILIPDILGFNKM